MQDETTMPVYAIYQYVKSAQKVSVVLNRKKFTLEGRIEGFDEFFNLVLSEVSKVENGERKNINGRMVIKGESIAMVRTV
ncbi:LSM_domain-containing protein [Hexamita inflata]|uniref:LSM domain-containing protein n=1 Tax=Hexamita inflata TaxID=28002 RepID=A0AA86NPD4_9EUKA|nr:LSM domain-containing protein [Hexamita inflata]